jgi:hypothetical protein
LLRRGRDRILESYQEFIAALLVGSIILMN